MEYLELYSVAVFGLVVSIHGVIVNSILVIVAYRMRRHNLNVFLAILAASDLCTALGAIPGQIGTLVSQHRSYWSCFRLVFPTLGAICCGSYAMLLLGLDRLIALWKANEYTAWSQRLGYYALLLAPCVVLIAGFMAAVARTVPDETDIELMGCYPTAVLQGPASQIFSASNGIPVVLASVFYLIMYLKVRKMVSQCARHGTGSSLSLNWRGVDCRCDRNKTVQQTLVFILGTNFAGRMLAVAMFVFINASGLWDADDQRDTKAVKVYYCSIPALVGLSCNFYILYWRASDYHVQIRKLLCRDSATAVVAPLWHTGSSLHNPQTRHSTQDPRANLLAEHQA